MEIINVENEGLKRRHIQIKRQVKKKTTMAVVFL